MSATVSTLVRPQGVPAPAVPVTLADTGLGADQVEQLVVKALYGGEATGLSLADRLRLPYTVLEPIIERARQERVIEVRGAFGSTTSTYRYALTDAGRDRARQYLEINQYTGAAPVPLAAYVQAMTALADARGYIDRERLRRGFSHLVISEPVLDQLGPAVNANKAIFLYGAPGNGKTVIGEGLGRAIGGEMYMPYAIDVEGHIITMYDPINHVSLEEESGASSLLTLPAHDRRWVRIRRPVVVVGGELTLDMLDLTYNALSKFSEAPLQLKANGGVFLVDDFGRQRMRPEDLLNRWIVPLESRVDFLTLRSGQKFALPFMALVVFATNIRPAELVDEAFLRRIHYKIFAESPTIGEFMQIFEKVCDERQMPFDKAVVEQMLTTYYRPRQVQLRGCHPRDLVEQVVSLASYLEQPKRLTPELLDAACASYFVDDRETPATYA